MDPSKEIHQPLSPTEEDIRVSESLPLYHELSVSHVQDLVFPKDNASPEEVREFIVQLLELRGIQHDLTRRIAAKWTRGSGRELVTYSPRLFSEIFGHEDGWLIYKDARLLRLRTIKTTFMRRYNIRKQAMIPIFVLLELSLAQTLRLPVSVS